MIPNGIIPDTRSPEEKAKDHLHEELFGDITAPPVWVEKDPSTWKLTSQRFQDGSFSCVKQASASAVEAILGQPISAATYQLRANKPDGGMFLQNCGDIDYNNGTILETITPSQNVGDPVLDSIVLPTPLNIKITGYRTFATINIDSIAQVVQSYKNCIIVIHSNWQEYQRTPTYLGLDITFGHGICAQDFTLINGVKTLVCRDSAGQDTSPDGVRLITEDFLNHRCVGAMYYLGANVSGGFKHTFNTNLTYGNNSDEVKFLQKALQIDGEFTYPTITGNFGPITLTAVKAFQSKYAIPSTGFVGPMTRNKLNKLFS